MVVKGEPVVIETVSETNNPKETVVSETVVAEVDKTDSRVTEVKAKDSESEFVRHVYDCPSCNKKVKVVLDHGPGCGCPEAKNLYDWTLKHMGK